MSRWVTLLLFLGLVVGGGLLIGVNNIPGDWYRALQKPFFNPPNWVFSPVWTILYIMIAVAGWRIWHLPNTGGAMTAWWVQLGLNFFWSPIFFTLHHITGALVVILSLLVAIIAFIKIAWRHDRTAALLFLPYIAWVAFASALNGAIWMLNP